jgi:hypothetical protein
MNVINVSLAILIAIIVLIVLTPNKWTRARIPNYNKKRMESPSTPHDNLMEAIRNHKGRS